MTVISATREWSRSVFATPRLAVIGGGPKAHWAVDALLAECGTGAVDVTVFEPHHAPGAGPVYDPAQPLWQRMNLAAAHIDASGVGRGLGTETFLRWAAENGVETHTDDYPPRAVVGRYLRDQFERTRAASGLSVVGREVTSVRRRDGRFAIDAGGRVDTFDAVLVTTGHGTNPCRGLNSEGRTPAYPPSGLTAFPAGEPVDIKGLSLTFIDAALSLTEGRGGRFNAGRGGRVSYAASGREPSVLHAWSRSGRLMAPKPRGAVWDVLQPADWLVEHWLGEIETLKAGELTPRLRQIVCEAATSIYGRASTLADAAKWLRTADRDRDPVACFRRSLKVAAGRAMPDWPVAFGVAWRTLYDGVIRVVSHRKWTGGDADAFFELAAELERVAFGPPLANAERIAALLKAGRLTVHRSPCDDPRGGRVDARIAGGDPATAPVIGPLVEAGLAGVCPHTRRLRVGRDLAVIDAGGRSVEGLSALTRLAEGVVLGHDSLVRTHHPQVAAWAARTAATLLTPKKTALRSRNPA